MGLLSFNMYSQHAVSHVQSTTAACTNCNCERLCQHHISIMRVQVGATDVVYHAYHILLLTLQGAGEALPLEQEPNGRLSFGEVC